MQVKPLPMPSLHFPAKRRRNLLKAAGYGIAIGIVIAISAAVSYWFSAYNCR